ncbi:MAG: PKD domain-containing protein, partial [Bacteroidetes bacterium]|nr:PKD domain-containing protein [Bacteroidota bacterium]
DFGDGNFSTDPNPVHTYADTGTYTVCQVAYSFCGTDTTCQSITITCTPPDADFGVTSVELTATFSDLSSVADSVMYDFGDGTFSTDPNPTHTYTAAGTYTVCQIAYNECENDTVCVAVTITCTASEAGFGVTSVELTATFSDSSSVADSVLYDFGDGNTSTDPNPTHTYAAAGTYTVCQITYNVCANDTVCEEIVITCTEPTAAFAANVFNGLDVTFADSSANADSVLYDFGDGTTSSEADPTHTYPASGIYTVCQIAYNLCTPDTTCIEISVIATGIDDIPGLNTLNVYPNPNNGVFQIEVGVDARSEMNVEVMTIRGKKVFAKDYGTINGTIQEGIDLQHISKGVYFIRFTLDGNSVTRKLVID